MSRRPIAVALLWHMHQPYYKDLVSGEYLLPWVRLHAVKDYYDMAAVLDHFPGMKVNFNLVPSLLSQIDDYVSGRVSDKFLDLTVKSASDLTAEERVFVLQNFFVANRDNMINPYSRYRDLLLKRGQFVSTAELSTTAKRFSSQEILDLQVWHNLAWFGFISKNEDPIVVELINKGKYFSEDDKKTVIKKQFEIMSRVMPKCKELSDRGQIEISTTPFYHPILPLLCDSSCAKEAMPRIKLPDALFRHPEDAQAQIEMAVKYHEQKFGKKPRGMWPSEGSVSEQIIPLAAKHGIEWLATDEAILERSVNKIETRARALTAEERYQPYTIEKDGASVAMIFRNHFLSDQLGFVYYRWRTEDAIKDFLQHLNNIRSSIVNDDRQYIVPIILDGENAWEYYEGGGKKFLEAFYQAVSCSSVAAPVKIGDYLKENPPQKKMGKLFSGSWIDNNFKIWIGDEEDNLAWDYLSNARLVLEGANWGDIKTAWQELYIAEGSDWCWWYGNDHSSENDAAFDLLFRKHLKNIYTLIGRQPPKQLDIPIKQLKIIHPLNEPAHLINPVLDGQVTDYYEWLPAGHFDIAKARGAMHQIETLLTEFYYGFSLSELFVRLGVNASSLNAEIHKFAFSIVFSLPTDKKAEISYNSCAKKFEFKLYKMDEKDNWSYIKNIETFGVGRIIECAINFSDLDALPGQMIEFVISASKDGQEIERWPRGGFVAVALPTENYENEQWHI